MFRPIILSSRVLLVLSILAISFLAMTEKNPSSQSLIDDKLLHFLCFAYLTIISKFAQFIDQDFWLYVIVFAYGILIEIVQMYLPYRSFEFLDIFANFMAILCTGFLLKLAKDLYISY
ncbi:VanZ family protein [Gammaproteobacteria bacterium]|jgi:VanZ family protein|nr:VanZ family protein [Gammaproteobacteria bacterium]MDA9835166.1 VanZ family protein [Gammaproteobacteria bacterium]MDC3372534.1 VanZ family protein [Gammaproteobacteria bacterium]